MKKTFLIIIITAVILGISLYARSISEKTLPSQIPAPVPDKSNLIRVTTPQPGETVHSPLVITGEARGNWFFEASFPVTLVNWDGLIIAEGIATAQSDWMVTDFVPFIATLNFTVDPQAYSPRGALIFRKDNPSDLPQFDDSIEIPIILGK